MNDGGRLRQRFKGLRARERPEGLLERCSSLAERLLHQEPSLAHEEGSRSTLPSP